MALALACLLAGGMADAAHAADKFQTLEKVQLVADRGNDGDSFLVKADDRVLHLRLYFADCAETGAGSATDARRLREQRRYFGVAEESQMTRFGKEAVNVMEQQLAKPFTVHTSFASAPGRSKIPRIYAFVTTADGQDLATLLVQLGLARAHGVRRQTPAGVTAAEMGDRLRDCEAAAMMKRMGIWSATAPDRLAELRAQQRAEDRELQQIQKDVEQKPGK